MTQWPGAFALGHLVLQNIREGGHPAGEMRPFVGISCCLNNHGPSALPNHAASDFCVNAADRMAGAVPVLIPALGAAADIDNLLCRLDGILLTGSRSHIDPTQYGCQPNEADAPRDTARDATTLPLIRAAIARGIPVLAICRGLQELNVALGGSLHQCLKSLPGRLDHSAPVSDDIRVRAAKAHGVTLRQGGLLHQLARAATIEVNSLHHQGIDRLAPGLAVEATAPDGTIEAVRLVHGRGFALGLQWHPEFDACTDAVSQRIFEVFGDAMREQARPAVWAAD